MFKRTLRLLNQNLIKQESQHPKKVIDNLDQYRSSILNNIDISNLVFAFI